MLYVFHAVPKGSVENANIMSVAYIEGTVCCVFGLLRRSLCSINSICDVLVGIDSIFGVAHLSKSTCIFHSTVQDNTGVKMNHRRHKNESKKRYKSQVVTTSTLCLNSNETGGKSQHK